jgi:hypothetical protein
MTKYKVTLYKKFYNKKVFLKVYMYPLMKIIKKIPLCKFISIIKKINFYVVSSKLSWKETI